MAEYKVVDTEQLEADLTIVADAIRAKTGGEEPLSFPEGMAGEVDAVFEAGKENSRKRFWDAYLANVKKTRNAQGLFSGRGWNNDTFDLPSELKGFTTAYHMFIYCGNVNCEKVRLIDFSTAEKLNALFQESGVEELPEISTIGANNLATLFYRAEKLRKIEKLILRNDGTQTFEKVFLYTYELVDLIIEGTIGNNGVSLESSTKLSKESILSIINALSSATSGLTVTLSLTAVNNAFETSAGAADGSVSEEWLALANTKSNWNIALV